jgi:hypothetical protein
MDLLKTSLRHEVHIRWPHLSLAILWDGISSMQTTQSTLVVMSVTLAPCVSRLMAASTYSLTGLS